MSDSASDRNVEDVLSSVRRLVSNELPRMPRPQPAKPAAALVLTEAHRIPERPTPIRRQNTMSLEDRIAELEAAVSARSDEWEPDGSEDQEQHRPHRIIYTRPPTEEEKSGRKTTLRLSQIALIETGPANEDEPEAAPQEPLAFRHDGAESTDSEQEATTTEQAITEEITETVSNIAGDALAEDAAFNAALADAVKRSIEEIPAEEAADTDAEPAPETSEAEATTVAVEVEAEADEVNETAPEPTNIAAPVAAPVALDQINLDDLRPLVSSLIREELQGELGERITRNVRKLVRREINRALSGREFE